MKREYKVKSFPTPVGYDLVEASLNTLANDGWRVVAVLAGTAFVGHVIYLERESA